MQLKTPLNRYIQDSKILEAGLRTSLRVLRPVLRLVLEAVLRLVLEAVLRLVLRLVLILRYS